jgi:hypothetical protein
MDPAMQQFLEAQTQLLQNLTNTVTNLQAQVNNPLGAATSASQQAPGVYESSPSSVHSCR